MPQHPLNILLCDFKRFFKQKYTPFFNKAQFDTREEAIGKLSLAIKAQDESLRELYPSGEIEEDGDSSQFDFAELVIGEVKKFTILLLLSVVKFYEPCFPDMNEKDAPQFQSVFQDKLMDFVLKLIFTEGSSTLYKVCHSMCRFETNEEEKTRATLIMSQKAVNLRTSDCNIAPIF